jgi:hypothetical protein
MRSTFFSQWFRANEQRNSNRHQPVGYVPIEPFEHRQLLTVASPTQDLTAPLVASARSAHKQDNSSAFPNMLGIYKGRITVKRAVGISPGSKLTTVLRFDQETLGGQLAGTMNITGVGPAVVTGTITRRDVNLSFINSDNSLNGTFTGTVTQDGQTFTGKIFSQINGTAVRGTFNFDKKRTFPFAFSNTLTPTTTPTTTAAAITTNNVSPSFLASQANGFITPITTPGATTTGVTTIGTTTPITTPVTGLTNPVSGSLTPSTTAITPTTTDLLASTSTVPTAGSILQTPFSAGSVLNTSIGTPGTSSALFSTTPIGSTTFF